MTLALLTLLSAHSARAQYPGGGYPGGGYPGGGGWVPSDANGNPLGSGGGGYPGGSGSNGPTPLVPGVGQSDDHNTYPIPPDADDFWFAAFSPNARDSGSGSDGYYTPSLTLNSNANNVIMDMYRYGHWVGTYAPDPLDPSEWFSGQTQPPDLIGTVHGDHTNPLTAHFVWTGPGPASDATFLVCTHVGATAGADYGASGQTSGLSATGTALIPSFGEQVGASVPDNPNPAPLNGRHLVRVSGAGGLATVTIQAEVKTDTSNSLPFSQWSEILPPPGGTSYYPPSNDHFGPTSATASAEVSATANYDNREVTISSDIEASSFKGGVDAQHPTGQWPHTRNGDGSMEVDAGVVPNTGILGGGWYHANVTYTANKVNFLNEGDLIGWYEWKHPGGTTGASQTGADRSINADYNFIAPTDSSPLGKSNTTSVKVTDDDGATASNTYTVHWHYPYENWAKNGQKYELAPLKYTSDGASVAANGVYHVTIPPNTVDYSIPSKIVGGLGTVGAAVFAPEIDPVALFFLISVGYTASLTEPPAGNDFPCPGNASQLSKDVNIQEQIKQTGTSNAFMPTTPRMTDALADAIQQSGDYDGYVRGGYGPPGLYFSVTVYQHKWHQDYIGDAYDGHGYAGQAPGYVNWTGGYEYVYSWALGYGR